MREAGLPDLTLRAAVVFPHRHSQVVLEVACRRDRHSPYNALVVVSKT